MDILYKKECYAIVGAAMKVHRALGHGFSESVYHLALIREFEMSGSPFETKKRFDVFKGVSFKHEIGNPD